MSDNLENTQHHDLADATALSPRQLALLRALDGAGKGSLREAARDAGYPDTHSGAHACAEDLYTLLGLSLLAVNRLDGRYYLTRAGQQAVQDWGA